MPAIAAPGSVELTLNKSNEQVWRNMHGYSFADDIEQVVCRVREAKGISDEDFVAKGVEVLKKIRQRRRS